MDVFRYFTDRVIIIMIGDFNSREPNQASEDALDNMMICGKAAGELTPDVQLVSSRQTVQWSLRVMCNCWNSGRSLLLTDWVYEIQ